MPKIPCYGCCYMMIGSPCCEDEQGHKEFVARHEKKKKAKQNKPKAGKEAKDE